MRVRVRGVCAGAWAAACGAYGAALCEGGRRSDAPDDAVWAFSVPQPLDTLPGDGPRMALDLAGVLVIVRHGDRTPLTRRLGSFEQTEEDTAYWAASLPDARTVERMATTFPVSCPTHEDTLDVRRSEFPNGQLTDIGCREMEALGAAMRSAWGPWLRTAEGAPVLGSGSAPGPVCGGRGAPDGRSIQVRSTNITRTIQSAQSLLHGLLPAAALGEVPVHVRPWADETMVPQFDSGAVGPALEKRIAELVPVCDRVTHDLAFLKAAVQRIFDLPANVTVEWSRIREILFCYMNHGRALPMTSPLRLYEAVGEYCERMQRVKYSDPLYRSMSAGPFSDDLVRALDGVASDKDGEKLLVFSGHDSTLVPLLYYLGAESVPWPTYATYLAVEVYTPASSGSPRVRVVYNGEVLDLPGSDASCTLSMERFQALLRTS